MSEHFNDLTPGQCERLALLLEEMGEAQQIIGKTLRHGYDSEHPDGGPTNRRLLEKEIGDVIATVDMLVEADDLDDDRIQDCRFKKHKTMKPYLHHQEPTSVDLGRGDDRPRPTADE